MLKTRLPQQVEELRAAVKAILVNQKMWGCLDASDEVGTQPAYALHLFLLTFHLHEGLQALIDYFFKVRGLKKQGESEPFERVKAIEAARGAVTDLGVHCGHFRFNSRQQCHLITVFRVEGEDKSAYFFAQLKKLKFMFLALKDN